MNPRVTILMLVIVVAISLIAGVSQAVYPLGMPFYLMQGESAEVGGAGLVVTFDQVLSDGRCPINLVCLWEGDAEVQLIASDPLQDDAMMVLHTAYDYPHSADVWKYRFLLIGLMPQPLSGVVIGQDSYQVMLLVTAINPTAVDRGHWSRIKAMYR